MTYTVNTSTVFEAWWAGCDDPLQDAVAAHVGLLASEGPQLGRPYADSLRGSSIPNLKELRVQHRGEPYRILFAFDPNREAILLLAGNKATSKRWYQTAIHRAEAIYEQHLKELEEQNA